MDLRGSDFLWGKKEQDFERSETIKILLEPQNLFLSLPTLSSDLNSNREAQLDLVRYNTMRVLHLDEYSYIIHQLFLLLLTMSVLCWLILNKMIERNPFFEKKTINVSRHFYFSFRICILENGFGDRLGDFGKHISRRDFSRLRQLLSKIRSR